MSSKSFAAVAGWLCALATLAAACAESPTQPTASMGNVPPASPAAAAPVAIPVGTASGTQLRTPIGFTLSGCPSLPAGLTVSGSGDDFLVINSRVDKDGVTHMERNDLVIGTATDSAGASYKFNYHNHANFSVPPGGFPLSISTTDHFNLIGNGHASQLHVSFVARVTFPSPSDPPIVEFVNSRGNPFACDPI